MKQKGGNRERFLACLFPKVDVVKKNNFDNTIFFVTIDANTLNEALENTFFAGPATIQKNNFETNVVKILQPRRLKNKDKILLTVELGLKLIIRSSYLPDIFGGSKTEKNW